MSILPQSHTSYINTASTNSIWLLSSFMLHGVVIVKGKRRLNSWIYFRRSESLIKLALV